MSARARWSMTMRVCGNRPAISTTVGKAGMRHWTQIGRPSSPAFSQTGNERGSFSQEKSNFSFEPPV
ncbi:hypothetical protein D3C87_1900920 [compost metagenome]